MLQIPGDSSIRKEVSESIFEYFLGEILFPHPDSRVVVEAEHSSTSSNGSNEPTSSDSTTSTSAIEHRLESLGFDVGYRYPLCSTATSFCTASR